MAGDYIPDAGNATPKSVTATVAFAKDNTTGTYTVTDPPAINPSPYYSSITNWSWTWMANGANDPAPARKPQHVASLSAATLKATINGPATAYASGDYQWLIGGAGFGTHRTSGQAINGPVTAPYAAETQSVTGSLQTPVNGKISVPDAEVKVKALGSVQLNAPFATASTDTDNITATTTSITLVP